MAPAVFDQAADEPVEILTLHRLRSGRVVVVEQRPFARLRPTREPSAAQKQRWAAMLAQCESFGLVLPLPPSSGGSWARFSGVAAFARGLGKARPSVVQDLKRALIWRASLPGPTSGGAFR
jgi:hypothetical protein